jgi:hypothetical protein
VFERLRRSIDGAASAGLSRYSGADIPRGLIWLPALVAAVSALSFILQV